MKERDIFLSAIKGNDGAVNVGYLMLIRGGEVAAFVVLCLVAGSVLEFWMGETTTTVAAVVTTTRHVFNVVALATGIAYVMGAFGAYTAAVGAFLWGDSRTPQQAVTRSTFETSTPALPEPPAAPIAPAPAEAIADLSPPPKPKGKK